jgi:peptidoglycan/xylan/chitin deacetylase (PgdA/CDA1 family)
MLYHDVSPTQHAQFEAQLRWLSQSWRFVSPQEFVAMLSGAMPARGRNLLLTFDDGFASNRSVAEQVLAPMGVRALFFVVSDFVTLESRQEARAYVARHIQPGKRPEDIPAHLYNMDWPDLEALLEQGHSIGGHTRSHARLSELGENDLQAEIVHSADTLSQRLGAPIEHFAYPFGDVASVSSRAFAIARTRFRYVYSGLRGGNARQPPPVALCRDAVSPADSIPVAGALLEGAADLMYVRSRVELAGWARQGGDGRD